MPSASNPRALSLMHSSICSAVPHCSVPALGAAGSTAVGVGPTSFGVLGFAATTEMKEKKKRRREKWLFQRRPFVESWDEWHKAMQLHRGRGITMADSHREGKTCTEIFQSVF